jgi:hypothetical protein
MRLAYGESIHVFTHIRNFASFDGPNVYPGRARSSARSLDAHREASQNDNFVCLCDEFLRLKFYDILHFTHPAEELCDLLASFPGAGERYVWHFGQLSKYICG